MTGFFKYLKYLRQRKEDFTVINLAVGLNSSIDFSADLHIIMLDFDISDLSKVKESVVELQSFWKLSDADVFRTKKGFHVFFWFDHVPYDRLKMIINYAKFVDPLFKYISRFYSHKTIRVSGKYSLRDIWFVETIKGVRTPLLFEKEIGLLKKREHSVLVRRI